MSNLIPCVAVLVSIAFMQCKTSSTPKANNHATEKINRSDPKGTNTFVVSYDFLTKTYDTNNVRPRINHPIVFRVKNVNRLAYNVTITSRDSVLSDEGYDHGAIKIGAGDSTSAGEKTMPPLTDSVQLPSLQPADFNADPKSVQSLVKAFSNANVAIGFEIRKSELINDIESTKAGISSAQLEKENITKQYEQVVEQTKSAGDSASRQLNELRQTDLRKIDTILQSNINRLEKKLKERQEELKVKEAELKNVVVEELAAKRYQENFSRLIEIYLSAMRSYRKLWEVSRMNNNLLMVAQDPLLTFSKFSKLLVESQGIPSEASLFGYRTEIANFYQHTNEFITEYEMVLRDPLVLSVLNPSSFEKLNFPARVFRRRIDEMAAKIRQQNLNATIKKMSHILATLSNPASYTMTSAPIQPSQDLVVFDVQITNRQTQDYHDSRSFSYREYVRGGVRYDFSTGIAFGFGIDDFSYRTAPSAGDSVTIVKNKKTNMYMPSITGMFHASIRSWRTANLAFTLGASLSTTTLDINSLFPGISLMIGKSEKWIITAGPALKKVNYLEQGYEEGKNYTAETFPGDVPTATAFRVGAFVAFSYNLTKKQKSSFKLVREGQ